SPTPGPGLRATPPAAASVPPREDPTLPPPAAPPDLPDPTEAAGRTAEGMDEPPPAGGSLPPPPSPAAGEDVAAALDRRVGEALNRGIAWLKKAQSPDGSWGRIKGNKAYDDKAPAGTAYEHPAGPTALALYALLKSGVPVEDGAVRRGFKYLKDKAQKPGSAY